MASAPPSGPYGGAANPLGPNDLNTIQSYLENKDTYEFVVHFGDIACADYFIKESWEGYFGNNSLIPNTMSAVEGYNSMLEKFYDQTPHELEGIYGWVRKPRGKSSVRLSCKFVDCATKQANCDNGSWSVGRLIRSITYTTSICIPGQTNFTGCNSVDPAGLDNPQYPWSIVNGAAGHYDGFGVLRNAPYYADKSISIIDTILRLTLLSDDPNANGTVLDSATLYKEHKFSNGQGNK
ncbi:hypothetical protein BS17DRAFT_833254 [Gyrodon lividus]|nr:hypothetical protein BS17DRAFT_833254 [Gyrodon lividus]